jgi:hypothetical protein
MGTGPNGQARSGQPERKDSGSASEVDDYAITRVPHAGDAEDFESTRVADPKELDPPQDSPASKLKGLESTQIADVTDFGSTQAMDVSGMDAGDFEATRVRGEGPEFADGGTVRMADDQLASVHAAIDQKLARKPPRRESDDAPPSSPTAALPAPPRPPAPRPPAPRPPAPSPAAVRAPDPPRAAQSLAPLAQHSPNTSLQPPASVSTPPTSLPPTSFPPTSAPRSLSPISMGPPTIAPSRQRPERAKTAGVIVVVVAILAAVAAAIAVLVR